MIHRFPRPFRFPREEETYQHSMVRVWHALFRIASGHKVDKPDMILASRWFGVKITQDIAEQLTRKGADLHIRFPREKHGKKS